MSRRALRSFPKVRICLAVLLCCPLLLTSFVYPFTLAQGERLQDAETVRSRPRAAAPEGIFPNLDEVRQARPGDPPLLFEMPSTMRSPRTPLVPRDGKRVGDPGTTQIGGATSNEGATIGASIGTRERRLSANSSRPTAAKRSHHARLRAKSRVATAPPSGDTQYIEGFFQTVLLRWPYSNEYPYWNDILRAAYPNGQSSMVKAVRELGKTLFESAEYIARGTTATQFVTDLYWAYLMRAPDPGGLAYWTVQVPLQGRENVRRAFDESAEFATAVSTITSGGSASSSTYSLMTQRLEGVNQPGGGLHSRDAQWALSLLSLPGRAGMDLGLTLSYSSAAVWTRSGPYIYFDEDNGWPSPGFRFGFPTIQEAFFNAQAGKNAFLLINSGGSRVELRQVGTSTTYESVDSSYMQLTDEGSNLTLRATDGTQLKFTKYNNEWRCIQVKDSNGNFITVNYNALGHITSIVDTLNRTITFAYDVNENLTAMRTTRSGVSHDLVTFGWINATINPGYSGLVGSANWAQIPVLQLVWLDDGSYYKFGYTGANGQVALITRYASDSNPSSDNHRIAYTYFDFGATDDVLRLTATRTWAENWAGINTLPSEIQTSYGVDLPNSSCSVTTPDGTVYKEFYGTGWQRGLVTQTEIWGRSDPDLPASFAKQKWTTNTWTQDNTGVSYQTNPRVTQTLVQDGTNQRLTTIDYQTFSLPSGASCSLPRDVYEYQGGSGSALYRRTRTDYNLDTNYLNSTRRILGLPSAKYLCDAGTQVPVPCTDSSGASLQAKTTFLYDEAGSLENQTSQVQHDDDNFGMGLTSRGNLSSTRRYNVDSLSQYTTVSAKYNTGGSVTSTTDASGHITKIDYTDSFSEGTHSPTYAYPTKIKDPDYNDTSAPNNYSTIQYQFDLGKPTRTEGPKPAGQSHGLTQTISYEYAGRVERVTTANAGSGAYQRFWYGPTYIGSFSTVNSVADEFYSTQTFDGMGRVIGVASGHPGSAGGYKAQNTIYDAMGRVWKRTNPAEITGYWVPYGDDAAGWLYTQQTYDWKGRPLKTTNTDLTFKQASYAGCGCAGGEVMTLTDEGTIDGGVAKKRQQKLYADFLGRTLKTETLNGSGGTPYTTTVNTYNVRDQITKVKRWPGAEGTGTAQETTTTYDGYARLKTRHLPEQQIDPNLSGSTDHTTWSYNADDTISIVTDARGASRTFTYNGRHLVTDIDYSVLAGSNISVPASVDNAYDAAGNRISMTDGLGTVSYTYDELSQLKSEARTFNDPGNSAMNGVVRSLQYDYNLAGQLKKLKDFTNMSINYSFDSVARVTSVFGSDTLYASQTQYASSFGYRAWGGLKQMTDGANRTVSYQYNARLQPSQFQLSGGAVTQTFDYYADGRIKYVHNTTDVNFDRLHYYDNMGRLTEVKTGGMARGDSADIPYHETFGYDKFSHLTARSTETWSEDPITDSATYSDNRRSYWGYDADGRIKAIDTRSYAFDAAGQMKQMNGQRWILALGHYVPASLTTTYAGDGASIKEVTDSTTTYHLRSTVLNGAIIAEMNSSGQKTTGYVYLGDRLLSTQFFNQVTWHHDSPIGTARYSTDVSGNYGRTEFDPSGADVGVTAPLPPDTGGGQGDLGANHFGGQLYARYADIYNSSSGCMVNGHQDSCDYALFLTNFGSGRSSRDLLSTSLNGFMDTLAQSVPATLVQPDGTIGVLNVSGTDSTTGHTEDLWKCCDDQGNMYPQAQIFSGSQGTPGSQVLLSSTTQTRPQNTTPEQRASTRARELISQSNDCSNFIRDLIGLAAQLRRSAFSNTFPENFDPILGPNGDLIPSYTPDTALNAYEAALSQGRVTASGQSGVRGNVTTYGETTGNTTIIWNREFYSAGLDEQALHTLHESLHLFTNFSDFVIADAAHIIATRNRTSAGTPGNFRTRTAASQYINERIAHHCRP
jgi:YD repeat-containing protein